MKKLFLIICLLLSAGFQIKAQELTPQQLQSDYNLFRKALQEVHPHMYYYTSRQVFDSLFAATEAKLNKHMSQHEFYTTMVPLIAALHDGHMKWIVAGKDQHYPFFTEQLFPLQLYFVGDKAWVRGNYGNSQVPAGAELISINGTPVNAIIKTLLPNITFADGFSVQGKYEELNHFFSGYYATFKGPSDSFDITYQEKEEQKTVKLAAVTEKMIKEYEEKNKPAPKQPFRLTFHTDKTAILTIERFWDNKKEQDYKKFLKESFRKLKQEKVQHLVLDVRNNEGGEEPYGLLLYSYLARKPFRYYDHIKVAQKEKISFQAWRPKIYDKVIRNFMLRKREDGYVFHYPKFVKTHSPKHDAYTGELYVLVNGNSFSVTTEFSARAHADGRATFFGQETAGGYRNNSSGLFTILQLPNSKIDLGIPMFGYHMANVPAEIKFGQAIEPKYVVVPSIEDVLKGNDPVLEHALEFIEIKSAVPATGHTSK